MLHRNRALKYGAVIGGNLLTIGGGYLLIMAFVLTAVGEKEDPPPPHVAAIGVTLVVVGNVLLKGGYSK